MSGCLQVTTESLEAWLCIAAAFGTLGTCGEALVAPWRTGCVLGRRSAHPATPAPRWSVYEEATLRSPSKTHLSLSCRALTSFSLVCGLQLFKENITRSEGTRWKYFFFFLFFVVFPPRIQSSECLGHSLSRNIFPTRGRFTERVIWRARRVSFSINSWLNHVPAVGNDWITDEEGTQLSYHSAK